MYWMVLSTVRTRFLPLEDMPAHVFSFKSTAVRIPQHRVLEHLTAEVVVIIKFDAFRTMIINIGKSDELGGKCFVRIKTLMFRYEIKTVQCQAF